MTTNKIRNYNIRLKFYWIFNYASIESNKMIDKMIKRTYNFILFSFKHLHHEIITRVSFIRVLSRKIWDKRWKEKIKETQYRKLISKVNYYYLNIYVERLKTYNAFIIQLRINKIEFNKFLHKRYVFNVLTT